jgi:ATP/maltotriose-dependent transcriptional regulator MalT
LVVLSGEPGIGKTALIGEVLERGRSHGYEILSARASEFERDVPFVAFADALEGAVRSLGLGSREMVDEEQLALLASVFPSLEADRPPAPRSTHPDERHLLLRALHEVLELLASKRPLVLALDDLQWADPASVDLICRLLHRGLSNPALVLLASRPGQSEPRLRTAFADAERYGQALHMELGPLSAADAKELLGSEVNPMVAEWLHRESGGNPFYLEQLLATRATEALPEGKPALGLSSVPRRVSAAIRSELDGLSPSARMFLQGASVVGDPFEPELAGEVAGLAERDALSDLDELLERDLVRTTDSPRRFSFRHPIVRGAVYEAAGPGWCLQAHSRAAALLETRGAPAATRAPHIERSARVGDLAGVAALAQAGQELMSRSPASAAHWFEVALDLTPARGENHELRLGLTAQHAMALGLAGQIKAGREVAGRLLALAPPELHQQATDLCVAFDIWLGNPAGARRLLLDGLARLDDQAGRDAAKLKYGLASTYFFEADWRAMRHWASEALTAECHGIVRAGTLAVLVLADYSLSNLAGVHQTVAEAMEVFNGLPDQEVAGDLGVTIFLVQAEIQTDRLAEAVNHIERSIAIAHGSGQRLFTVGLLAVKAQALAAQGRITELAAVADMTTETALLSTSDTLLSMAMAVRSVASAMTGDLYSALRSAERGARSALGPMNPVSRTVRLFQATILLEMGETKRCRDLLTDSAGEPRLPPGQLEKLAYEVLVRAELALGNLARAEEHAHRSAQAAARLGTNLSLAAASRALALVSLARGETQAALDAALESYDAAERVGARVDAARSQTLAGQALAASGERAAAVATLEAAHEKLLACGALHYANQTARELRKLGRAVPRSGRGNTKPGILGLTDREREVIEQVADGKTNREIADNLFLSPRTIDRHIARIFEKLGVHSRAAATSIFERANNRS